MPTHAKDLLASLRKADEGRGKDRIMKFQRGDLVEATWYSKDWKLMRSPAIVIEAKSDSWVEVWIPAQNDTSVTIASELKHYDPK